MAMNTTTGESLLRPESVGKLVIQPVARQSVGIQASTLVQTASLSHRIPIVTSDPAATWVAEGGEISLTDQELDEVIVTPAKLAGLTVVSNELVADSDPSALETVGQGLARDLARKLDVAFFGNLASPAPKGLESVVGVSDVAAGASWTTIDAFLEAQSVAEQLGATITMWATAPATALALAKIKKQSGSVEPLLQRDPTQAGQRVIAGVPLIVSPAVAAGTVWGIPKDRSFVVIRRNVEITRDTSAFFTSDRTAIRAIMRVGFGFPHEAAVVKIAVTP